jgi:transposase
LLQKTQMKQNEIQTPKIQLKAYSLTEVAMLYEVSGRTLKTWLTPFKSEIGQKVGRYYTPKQMKVIFERLGMPDSLFLN